MFVPGVLPSYGMLFEKDLLCPGVLDDMCDHGPGAVQAFVQFTDAGAAARSKEALNGIVLAGGQVSVTYVSQEVFAAII